MQCAAANLHATDKPLSSCTNRGTCLLAKASFCSAVETFLVEHATTMYGVHFYSRPLIRPARRFRIFAGITLSNAYSHFVNATKIPRIVTSNVTRRWANSNGKCFSLGNLNFQLSSCETLVFRAHACCEVLFFSGPLLIQPRRGMH